MTDIVQPGNGLPQPSMVGLPDTVNAIRLVKVTQGSSGTPGSFPNVVGPCVYKCMPITVSFASVEGAVPTLTVSGDPDRAIYVANFRNNAPVLNQYYIVFRLSTGAYVFDNQACFLENM